MYAQRIRIAPTTDASGDVTAFSTEVITGRVLAMIYTPDGTAPLATGADITVTGDRSAQAVLTKANIGTSAFTSAPRQATHLNTDGTAALYAAAGSPVLDHITLVEERIKLVVAQGGDTKTGTFDFIIG